MYKTKCAGTARKNAAGALVELIFAKEAEKKNGEEGGENGK
jgi:hypothetical protein